MAAPYVPGRGGKGRRPFDKNSGKLRRNERIRVPEVRVIAPAGDQIGVMKTREALELAKRHGLDLVEISPNTRPPVCKIVDFGKFQYEQKKKEKESGGAGAAKKNNKIKEVKFRVKIDTHDYETKLRLGEKFLYKGFKLKITLMFRGREMEHKHLGFEVMKRAVEDLAHVGSPDNQARLAGRNIGQMLSPLPENKRTLKFARSVEEDDDDEGDDAGNAGEDERD